VLLTIALAVELVSLIGAERYANLLTVSIESTELWFNPWSASGDQTDVANDRSKMPSSASIPADNGQTGAANADRRTAFLAHVPAKWNPVRR
jgi:hypothetical protein